MSVDTFRNLAMLAAVVVLVVVGLLWWSTSKHRGWRPTIDWRYRWQQVRSRVRRRSKPAPEHTVASDHAAATLSSGVSEQEADIVTGRADPTRQVCLGAIIPNTPLSVEVERSRAWLRRAIRGERRIEDPANRYQNLRSHSDALLAAYSPVGLSTLVVGPSGTGKSSGVIIPATLTCGTSSMLNLSVKRDVCEITYKQRHLVAVRWNETKKDEWPTAFCVVFDPAGPDNLPPALAKAHVYWSPLTLILKDTREDLQTAKNLASSGAPRWNGVCTGPLPARRTAHVARHSHRKRTAAYCPAGPDSPWESGGPDCCAGGCSMSDTEAARVSS